MLGLRRTEMIRHVILPGALPQALVGLRQSLGVAWLALVVAEQVNANAGIGFIISQATQFLRNDVILVALLVYAALGLLTDALVRLLERKALAWHRGLPGPMIDTVNAAARVRGLTRDFGDRRVLDGLDLDIAPGEFVAMLGVSGTGKSTLLRALAGLDRDVTGEIDVPGTVAVAFQEPRLLPWRRVLANVALGLRVPEPEAVARSALAEVGLADHADAWPGPSRVVRPSGWPWLGRWYSSPNCSSWTSPSPHSTPSPASGCRRWSLRTLAPGTVPASYWSPTTSKRPCCSPTGCSSWPTAALPSAARSTSPVPGTVTIPG